MYRTFLINLYECHSFYNNFGSPTIRPFVRSPTPDCIMTYGNFSLPRSQHSSIKIIDKKLKQM